MKLLSHGTQIEINSLPPHTAHSAYTSSASSGALSTVSPWAFIRARMPSACLSSFASSSFNLRAEQRGKGRGGTRQTYDTADRICQRRSHVDYIACEGTQPKKKEQAAENDIDNDDESARGAHRRPVRW